MLSLMWPCRACNVFCSKIAKEGIGVGLKVWCLPGISKINLIPAFFWRSRSHSKLDLKSLVVFVDVSLVMTTRSGVRIV